VVQHGWEPTLDSYSGDKVYEDVSKRASAVEEDEALSSEKAGLLATNTPRPVDEVAVNAESKLGKNVSGPAMQNRREPLMGDMPATGALFRTEDRFELLSEMQAGTKVPSSVMNGLSVAKPNQATVADPNHAIVSWHYKALDEDASDLPSESRFKVVPVNPWVMTERDAQSTFALDVDTASYALCRRYIRSGFLPPIGAVRMEEFINAFDYAYPQRDMPTFSVYAEGAPSPFAPAGQDLTLLKIAVKARTVGRDQRRAAHLVFVIDASASMGQADRLGVVQSALNLLTDRLSEGDRVSLITCANEARLHLEAVSARQKGAIRQTIDVIQPAGPTNLLAGLKLGYAVARRAFVAGQINQVVLCSDGVANVGQVEADAVLEEVAEDRQQGITLTCVGVGYGAYNDAFLEALADHGDGRYVFLDAAPEAQESFVGQLTDTLQTVAKDARIQVQFDPACVRRYRLIGYENRDIEDQRFRDDTIDAGEVGSGQCSTALYELELTNQSGARDATLGTVFVRYRDMETDKIEEISRPLAGSIVRRRSVEEDPRFFLAAGAARFAEWLRQSEHAQHTSLPEVQRLLDDVSAVLPLDRDIQELAALAHQAESLPRAP
jgi:Ca-activated chloride channel family protein